MFRLSDGRQYDIVKRPSAHADSPVVIFDVQRYDDGGSPTEAMTFEWEEDTGTLSPGVAAAQDVSASVLQEARDRVLRLVMGLAKTRRA